MADRQLQFVITGVDAGAYETLSRVSRAALALSHQRKEHTVPRWVYVAIGVLAVLAIVILFVHYVTVGIR